MKHMFAKSKKFLLASSVVVMSAFALTSCSKDDDGSGYENNTMYTISGNANGSQMVPSVSGNGTATISGTYNANTGVLNYTTNWTGLSGAPTSGAFYTGATGSNGTMVGNNWTLGTGLTGTGTLSGTTTLTADQFNSLRSGNWYYSLGTSTNTNGEVRGQITATPM
jgi:hypothetical protein